MFRQERIAKAIAASGKQKQQIATECGVSNASVSQWISGESKSMKPENLYALAEATGFNPKWLAIGEGPERPVQVVEAERTPELHKYMEQIGGVVNYVNQTFGLFKAAEALRPAKLLTPKVRE